MNKQQGSITIPCLLVAFLLLSLVTGVLVSTTREYEHTKNYLINRQLRLLASSVFKQAEAVDYGQKVLLEAILYPDREKVVLTLDKTKSSDGLISKMDVTAEAVSHAGAMQRFRKCSFHLTPDEQALVRENALIGVRFQGLELLDAEARYIQAQEVSLPQISFLKILSSDTTASNIANDGLNAGFYYIDGSFTFPVGGKTIAGSTVFAASKNIEINANTRFTGRVAFISEKGMISISKNCRFDNALLIASNVLIQEGCKLSGCIISPSIIIRGTGSFTPSAAVAEPFISAVTIPNAF